MWEVSAGAWTPGRCGQNADSDCSIPGLCAAACSPIWNPYFSVNLNAVGATCFLGSSHVAPMYYMELVWELVWAWDSLHGLMAGEEPIQDISTLLHS